MAVFSQQKLDLFQSTPPVWAETFAHAFNVNAILTFQSTPPVWAETLPMPGKLPLTKHFNPLRPCGRRPFHCDHPFCITNFNPLRPCGRRPENEIFSRQLPHFNPLRPCGRRQKSPGHWPRLINFNPLRPCGRRQQKKPFFRLLSISITTYFTEKSKRTRCKFSHLGYLFQYSLLILVRTSLYVDV